MPLPVDYVPTDYDLDGNYCPAMLVKSQQVRLIDIFILGPAMVYVAVNSKQKVPDLIRAFVCVSGVATTLYNGVNYIQLERLKRRANELSKTNT